MTREELRIPIWDTDTVKDESILMVRNAAGRAAAPLLYEPLEILSVTNSMKTETYTEGEDWVLENGSLVLTENSRIFSFTEEELYPAAGEEGKSFPKPDGYILFSEGAFFIEKQIAVTYRCEKGGWKGVVPALADSKLPGTFRKLRNGEKLSLVLFGDSISAKANATAELNIPPYQPDYGMLLLGSLQARYGDIIRYTNNSVGGKETNWAIETVEENVLACEPDLVIVGFGMNDGAKTPEQFEERIRTLIGKIRAKRPGCEFVLIATSLPNPILTDPRAKFWGYQEHYLPRLQAIEADVGGIAVANITDVHRTLLARKRFIDLTSNHVNHPNDFFYRCHANFLEGMLIEK